MTVRRWSLRQSAVFRLGQTRSAKIFSERWLAFCRAVRQWALAHPHEYALIYGYHEPEVREVDVLGGVQELASNPLERSQ